MVVHACNPRTQESEAGLGYKVRPYDRKQRRDSSLPVHRAWHCRLMCSSLLDHNMTERDVALGKNTQVVIRSHPVTTKALSRHHLQPFTGWRPQGSDVHPQFWRGGVQTTAGDCRLWGGMSQRELSSESHFLMASGG
jgi:hypothetical protein